MGTVSAAERRARLLLAAYPWRVRTEQGDEIVGTVLDALPPGSTRLPWRDQVDLVRGGIRMRNQRRPPWPTVLAYNSSLRIGPQWIGWVFDDLEQPRYVRAKCLRLTLWWALVVSAFALPMGDLGVVVLAMGGTLVATMLQVPTDRERKRTRYGLAPGGRHPALLWVERPQRPRLPDLGVGVVALVVGLAAAIGGGAVTWAAGHPVGSELPGPLGERLDVTIHPDAGPLAPAVTGGAVAAAVILVAGARLWSGARRRPVRPRQPTTATAVVAGVVGGGLAVGLAVLTMVVRWRWQGGGWANVGVGLVAPGVVLALLGTALLVVGRRRGGALGLWDLLPRFGPGRIALPVAWSSFDPTHDRAVWPSDLRRSE